jgi:Protein of unknown function (DUF2800)
MSSRDAAHSELAASAAHRWMACPGSARMTRGVPEEPPSLYIAEGLVAHDKGRVGLQEDREPREFLGQRIGDVTVTAEMVRGVELYVDLCRAKIDVADRYWIEQRIDLAPLNPPIDMFGTVDFAAYIRRRRELHIVDFKYGRGTFVPARGNPQMLYYALGATYALGEPVSRVSMTVVQPRFGGNADPIRTVVLDAVELAEFSFTLMNAARAALAPDAPTVAGNHCRFCRAQGSCLTYQNMKSQAAYHQFALPVEGDTGTPATGSSSHAGHPHTQQPENLCTHV